MQSNGLHFVVCCPVSSLFRAGVKRVSPVGGRESEREGKVWESESRGGQVMSMLGSFALSFFLVLSQSSRQTLSLLITKREGKINVCCHVCPAKTTTREREIVGCGVREREREDGSRVYKRMLRTLRK